MEINDKEVQADSQANGREEPKYQEELPMSLDLLQAEDYLSDFSEESNETDQDVKAPHLINTSLQDDRQMEQGVQSYKKGGANLFFSAKEANCFVLVFLAFYILLVLAGLGLFFGPQIHRKLAELAEDDIWQLFTETRDAQRIQRMDKVGKTGRMQKKGMQKREKDWLPEDPDVKDR